MSKRGLGGVVIATASKPSTLRINSLQSVKVLATPCPDRLDVATSSKRLFPSIAGTCWSAAILPKPMIAILIGFTI